MPEKAQDRNSLRVEAAGLAYLKLRLLQAGFEVAVPDFDNGIDLIAFKDRDGFRAWPVQLKAATDSYFSVHQKYARRGLYYAFVWHVFGEPSLFILSYEQALNVLGREKQATASFQSGKYTTTAPSQQIRKDLEPFSTPESWFENAPLVGADNGQGLK